MFYQHNVPRNRTHTNGVNAFLLFNAVYCLPKKKLKISANNHGHKSRFFPIIWQQENARDLELCTVRFCRQVLCILCCDIAQRLCPRFTVTNCKTFSYCSSVEEYKWTNIFLNIFSWYTHCIWTVKMFPHRRQSTHYISWKCALQTHHQSPYASGVKEKGTNFISYAVARQCLWDTSIHVSV